MQYLFFKGLWKIEGRTILLIPKIYLVNAVGFSNFK